MPNHCPLAATGITVRMLTGDNARTAASIARQCGILPAAASLDGLLAPSICLGGMTAGDGNSDGGESDPDVNGGGGTGGYGGTNSSRGWRHKQQQRLDDLSGPAGAASEQASKSVTPGMRESDGDESGEDLMHVGGSVTNSSAQPGADGHAKGHMSSHKSTQTDSNHTTGTHHDHHHPLSTSSSSSSSHSSTSLSSSHLSHSMGSEEDEQEMSQGGSVSGRPGGSTPWGSQAVAGPSSALAPLQWLDTVEGDEGSRGQLVIEGPQFRRLVMKEDGSMDLEVLRWVVGGG